MVRTTFTELLLVHNVEGESSALICLLNLDHCEALLDLRKSILNRMACFSSLFGKMPHKNIKYLIIFMLYWIFAGTRRGTRAVTSK